MTTQGLSGNSILGYHLIAVFCYCLAGCASVLIAQGEMLTVTDRGHGACKAEPHPGTVSKDSQRDKAEEPLCLCVQTWQNVYRRKHAA